MKPESEARAQFEKWANAKGATVECSWNGEYYENELVDGVWQGWKVAWQAAYAAGAADERQKWINGTEAIRARQQTGAHKKDCKYGDPFCPCQDGDSCNHEPFICRNPNHTLVDGSPSPHEIGPSCMAESERRQQTGEQTGKG